MANPRDVFRAYGRLAESHEGELEITQAEKEAQVRAFKELSRALWYLQELDLSENYLAVTVMDAAVSAYPSILRRWMSDQELHQLNQLIEAQLQEAREELERRVAAGEGSKNSLLRSLVRDFNQSIQTVLYNGRLIGHQVLKTALDGRVSRGEDSATEEIDTNNR